MASSSWPNGGWSPLEVRRILRTGARPALETATADGSVLEVVADAADHLAAGAALTLVPLAVRAYPAN